MAVPKKRTLIYKKRICKNLWKKGALGSVKSLFFSKISCYWEFQKFFCEKNKYSNLGII